MSKKLDLTTVLSHVDNKNMEFWSQLSPDEQKELKSSLFILNRYVSSVAPPKPEWKPQFKNQFKTPSREEQEYFILSVNEYFNQDWDVLQQHPELLWKLLCLCGYSVRGKKFFHQWIGIKKAGGTNKKSKFLLDLFPNKKIDEIELLATLTTDEELASLAKDHGFDDNMISKLLK